MGDVWSEYDPDITDVKKMQPHPVHNKLRSFKDTQGMLIWMPPSSMRSIKSRKRKRGSSEDDEVSTCLRLQVISSDQTCRIL
jgi:hypothetical protein